MVDIKKYIVVDGNYIDKIETDFEYIIGETIRYNSISQIKCISIDYNQTEINYIFTEGRLEYNYS